MRSYRDISETILAANPKPALQAGNVLTINGRLGRTPPKLLSPSGVGGAARGRATGANCPVGLYQHEIRIWPQFSPKKMALACNYGALCGH